MRRGEKLGGGQKKRWPFLTKCVNTREIGCDVYPYSASSSTLDLKQVTDEFDIVITWSQTHPQQAGKTLAQIAIDWQMSMLEAAKLLMPAGGYLLQHGRARRPPSVELSGQYDWL